jgi:hypothetical protein
MTCEQCDGAFNALAFCAQCWSQLGAENNKLRAHLKTVQAQLEEATKRRSDAELQIRAWEEAVNASCSCGGKGPLDDGVCQACAVYHRAKRSTEKQNDDGQRGHECDPSCPPYDPPEDRS